jgi:hypothetical protein
VCGPRRMNSSKGRWTQLWAETSDKYTEVANLAISSPSSPTRPSISTSLSRIIFRSVPSRQDDSLTLEVPSPSFFVHLPGQPSLDIAHVLLQSANVSNGPLFELPEMPCDDEECAGNIKRTLVGKLCIERRGFTGWGVGWRSIVAIGT